MILCLNETKDQLAIINSKCWHGYVLNRQDGNILKRALAYEAKDQGKKRSLKMA